jgi:lysophospholipase L1-like esterase
MRKKIVLIGDSIRMGYQETVRESLAGKADFWWPDANGAHSVNVLLHAYSWIQQRGADVVHLNAGLHDIRTVWYGRRDILVPIEHYRRNLRQLLQTARDEYGIRVAWATTTPVRDSLHQKEHAPKRDFDRYNADVLACNAAALEVCAELDVPVNDLYAVAMGAGLDRIQTEDGVHFTDEGSAILGRAVAAFLEAKFL